MPATKKENELANKLQPMLLVEGELVEEYGIESILDAPEFIRRLLEANKRGLEYLEVLARLNAPGATLVEGTAELDARFTAWVESAINSLPVSMRGHWAERLNGR